MALFPWVWKRAELIREDLIPSLSDSDFLISSPSNSRLPLSGEGQGEGPLCGVIVRCATHSVVQRTRKGPSLDALGRASTSPDTGRGN
jgi:hypothetical protein